MKNLAKLVEMKQDKTKISMITAYDFPCQTSTGCKYRYDFSW